MPIEGPVIDCMVKAWAKVEEEMEPVSALSGVEEERQRRGLTKRSNPSVSPRRPKTAQKRFTSVSNPGERNSPSS